MLDHFTILTPGGLVLWSRSFTPTRPPLDALIRHALIEQRSSSASSGASSVSKYDADQSTLLYAFDNELAIVFVVTYQRVLNLAYPPQLVERVHKDFAKLQRAQVERFHDQTKTGRPQLSGAKTFEWDGWDERFDRILKELETGEQSTRRLRTRPKASTSAEVAEAAADGEDPSPPETPTRDSTATSDADTIARNIAALKARQKAHARSKGTAGRRGGGSGTDTDSNAGSESDASPAKPKARPAKTATKWADSSLSASDLAAYDYSSTSTSASKSTAADPSALISKEALGKRDAETGMYEVADYATVPSSDDEDESEDEEDRAKPAPSTSSTFSSFFSRLSLSSATSTSTSKTLTESDLAPILSQMQSQLVAKNVASPIAAALIESIRVSLQGQALKSSGWTRAGGIKRQVKQALLDSLTKVLTPKTSTDLLLEISRKKLNHAGGPAGAGREPYSITFVGVNGVGKSTNLSKVAFWLLQNRFNVLIAACDTFRSGAVEQLRVHVNNLGKLAQREGGEGGKVELFERGYGKDAAGIAKDALSHAKANGFDVVLIDSAGRMQDNEPLMRALAKLISINQPDKVIFVGEALVGNEAVDQLTKFDRSLKNFSAAAQPGGGGERKQARGIDGMILTKFDTIDDKVGAALSMTYTTGQPIYFVGCGQTYSDLRMLRVNHIVQALLQD
ncbi:hypothetical protein JCM11491_006094 [Sporobolomyces phaffii]